MSDNQKPQVELKSPKYWRNRPVEERVSNLRIPPRYRNCSFDNFEIDANSEKVVGALQKWIGTPKNVEDGTGLYMSGSTGTGKTHLAVATLKEMVTRYQLSGLYLNFDVFVEMTYDSRGFDGNLPEMYGNPHLLRYARRVYDVVVIDNLNADRASDYLLKNTSDLIQSRYDSQLPTIFTSLLRPDKLPALFDARIASMIRQSTYHIHVAGVDYRTGGE